MCDRGVTTNATARGDGMQDREHATWNVARKSLAGKEDKASRDEYLRLLDLIARTPATHLPAVLVQATVLRELVRPEGMAPDDLEGALVTNICHALGALLGA
jgi:hypothetical protein